MRISDWSSDVCSSDLVDRSDTSVEIRDTFGAVALEAEEMQAYASRQSAVKSVDDRDNSIVAAHCTSAHRAHSDDPLIADHPLQRVEAAKIVVSVCSLDHGHQSIANADVDRKSTRLNSSHS